MSTPTNAVSIAIDPDPLDAYCISQGFILGDMIFLSGQASIDEEGVIVGVDDFDAQAAQVFSNISRLLQRVGSDVDKIFKVTIYLTDMTYFPKIVELRRQFFTRPWPADTIVEVSSLGLQGLLLEIDVMALVKGSRVTGTV
jgi:2-iminobutanoate/2-iminopropanoate deaminase